MLGETERWYSCNRPEVDRRGNVYENREIVGRLQLLEFPEEELLWKEGNNLFQAPVDVNPYFSESTVVFQGYLEESNADLARQMTDLIKVLRSYEASQKMPRLMNSSSQERLTSRAPKDKGKGSFYAIMQA